ncbi:MAG: lyase family protein [Ilumatobacteraceae bacterium]
MSSSSRHASPGSHVDTPLWGTQTSLAIDNFPISGRPLDVRVVHALAMIKRHAAADRTSSWAWLDGALGDAIAPAARAIEAGEHDEHFPIDVYQTGSGTSTNMNVNEVIASLADRQHDGDPCTPTTTSTPLSRRTTLMPSAIRVGRRAGDARRAGADAAGRSADGAADRAGDRFARGGEGRSHAPDGCNAGDARR